jgi:hypothetical protein
LRTIPQSQAPNLAGSFRSVHPLPRAEERVLHDVAGGGGVARDAEGHRQRDPLVRVDQRRERRRVATARPLDELRVPRIAHRRRPLTGSTRTQTSRLRQEDGRRAAF